MAGDRAWKMMYTVKVMLMDWADVWKWVLSKGRRGK